MDTEKQFHIFQENCGSYLRLTIPGQNPQKSFQVRWDRSMLHDGFVIPKSERAAMTQRYAQKGLLSHLDPTEIKKIPNCSGDYTVASSWNMDSANPARWRIFERQAYWALADRLWRPIFYVLKDNAAKFDYIEYNHPVLPPVVEMPFVDSFYAANQKEGAFLQKLSDTATRTTITPIHKSDEIVLKIQNHGFEHEPITRIQLTPTRQTDPQITLCDEELTEIKQSVLHRDAYLLNNLTNSERKHLSRHQSCPAAEALQLHWIHWLRLGGECQKSNAIAITPDTAIKYQAIVQRPFESFWEKESTTLQATGKPIYLDVPVPMTGYRAKTLKSTHMDADKRRLITRQERRLLNRQAKRLGDHEYGDD